MTKSVKEITDELSAIVDAADAEGRDLTEDELTVTAELETELGEAKDRQERTAAVRDKIAAEIADRKKAVTPALVTREQQGPDSIEAAFAHYLRTGQVNSDLSELRNAQSAGTGSEGGFTVPEGFRQKLVDRMKAFGGLATAVETITTESGAPLVWPTLDDTANSGEIVVEGATFAGGNDLVFGEASLGAYSYMSGGASGTPLRVSRELVQDSAFDVAGLVADKLGQRLARIQSTHLVSGTGSSQPRGITTGKTGIELAAATGITYADLLKFVHSVDPAYRSSGCAWAFNDASLQVIRGLVDDNGRPLLKMGGDSIASNPGGATLLGYPVVIDQAFPNINLASQTVNWGVFGNLREGYVIRRVRAVELLVNPYARMAYRQVEYSAWARMDATVQNTNAYVALTGYVA